ncbi:MAG TPA: zf-HC2 domain-containing protein [Tepidisphaeraceae bacterium]|jgi:hypothetical protein
MSQNQEIIESKLCAFIDGELDAEGRVEIEKHLEANPQHRRLLESLKATRDLIKWLPREAAPPEVAETLNGQLERSVLLDSDGDYLRPSIGPRIFAAAAIVALTAGLGLAVYYTLPKSQKNATPYAVRGGEGAGSPGSDVSGVESDRAEENSARRDSGATTSLSKSGVSNAARSMEKTASTDAEARELERWAKAVGENRDAINAVANGNSNAANVSQTAPPVAANAVVMLVRSNAPQDTRRQVTTFLDAQKIQWKETSGGTSQLELSQQPIRPETNQAQNSLRQMKDQRAFGGATTQPEVTAPPTTLAARSADGPSTADAINQQSQRAGLGATMGMLNRSAGEQGMYVARMSRQQAVSLGTAIAQEPAQSTELKDMAGTSLTLNELSAGKPTGGNSIAYNATVPSPTTEPASMAKASGAGLMEKGFGVQPGIGGFAGGGGGGGRGGRFGGNATEPSAPPAQSQPALKQAQGYVFPSPQVSQTAPPQVTQIPEAITSQPSEDALDVVIVVEAGAGNPTSTPATQPASQPASQPADVPSSQPSVVR